MMSAYEPAEIFTAGQGIMDSLPSFVTLSPLREPLIARLVGQVCRGADRDGDPDDILRACLGAALEQDLTEMERHWLIVGVEAQLDVDLTAVTA
jgi:hypothetical protein